MDNVVYGCDLSKKVTAKMARDAVIECFKQAHSEVLEDMQSYVDEKTGEEELEKIKELNIEMLVKSKFEEVGADYDNPKKQDIVKVCKKLAEFAENFRNPDLIKKHYKEIMEILEKVEG